MNCPRCDAPLAPGARYCASCGAPAAEADEAPTVARGPSPPTPAPSRSEARFVPGHVFDRRYRIVAPLGRGGMGEVYRAEDLRLGQSVALKFLPAALERDPQRLAMLLDEVRLARQVSHPHVCRVWDAGETAGLAYVARDAGQVRIIVEPLDAPVQVGR